MLYLFEIRDNWSVFLKWLRKRLRRVLFDKRFVVSPYLMSMATLPVVTEVSGFV